MSNAFSYGYLCSSNTWDNGTTGNYWGDYTIRYPNAGNDGRVWDTPYVINRTCGCQRDNYPLVQYPPVADFTANSTTIVVDSSVQFTFTGFDGNSPSTFQWDFGDGSANSTSQNPTHRYTTKGTFTATLTITDSDGDSDSATLVITVQETSDSGDSKSISGPGPVLIVACLALGIGLVASSMKKRPHLIE
ncbi:MAG: PKD domain-containing protein [Promethearchaeota archaeon]